MHTGVSPNVVTTYIDHFKRTAGYWYDSACQSLAGSYGPNSRLENETISTTIGGINGGIAYGGVYNSTTTSWLVVPDAGGSSLSYSNSSNDYYYSDMLATTTASERNLYVYGYKDASTARIACYWRWQWKSPSWTSSKENVEIELPYKTSVLSSVSQAALSGTTRYAAGHRMLITGKFLACYWVNDSEYDMYPDSSVTDDSVSSDINVYAGSNDTVYITGYRVSGVTRIPCLWIDCTQFEVDTTHTATLNSVYVKTNE